MPDFTKDDLQKVAQLSKLRLIDQDIEQRLKEFKDVLSHIDTLSQADVSQIQNPSIAGLTLNPDQPHQSFQINKALDNATDPQPPFFTIPKFMTSKGPA